MTCGRPTAELEGKLLVPNARLLNAIAQLASIGPYRLRRRRTQQLHSVYLDTADFTLARRGVALRLRRDGRRWEATVKWSGRVTGAMHERPELTVLLPHRPRLPFSLPEGALQAHLAALVKRQPLQAILVTDITRRRFDVLPARGGKAMQPIAELALDQVTLSAPAGGQRRRERASYCEVEIEQRHGSADDVARLTDLLRDQFGLTPSPDSKFTRGLRLLCGDRMPWKAPPQPICASARRRIRRRV